MVLVCTLQVYAAPPPRKAVCEKATAQLARLSKEARDRAENTLTKMNLRNEDHFRIDQKGFIKIADAFPNAGEHADKDHHLRRRRAFSDNPPEKTLANGRRNVALIYSNCFRIARLPFKAWLHKRAVFGL